MPMHGYRWLLLLLATVCASSAADEGGHPVGRGEYLMHCSGCHGMGGRGDGPAAASLKPPPPDLTRLAVANGGSFPETLILRIIDGREMVPAHGAPNMPVWGRRFMLEGEPEADIELRIVAILDYLESLQAQD